MSRPHCWATSRPRKNVAIVLTRKDQQCRFPAFWEHGNDYVPDEDNGGNGLNALQQMLLQGEGRRILLLPAWPKQWDCRFKLHAPLQTTVAGTVRGGKIESLDVEPRERLQDVALLLPDGGQLGNMHVNQILFLGNSITACPPKYWGLAASTADKDYAHLLVGAINAKTGGSLTLIRTTPPKTNADGSVDLGESNVVNIADVFERAYASYSATKLRKQIARKADVVVLQFGENIPPATFNAKVFKSGLRKLVADLKHSSNPHIFVPSYILGSNATVDEIKRNVCAEDPTHRVFVDLSGVGKDPSNIGDYGHPNDKGMALIADTLLKAILAHSAASPASASTAGK